MEKCIDKLLLVIFILFFITVSNSSQAIVTNEENSIIKIGVLAKRGKAKVIKRWSATADFLTKRIKGKTFKIVPLDFTEVESAVTQNEIEFLLTNSAMYVEFEILYGIHKFATLKNKYSSGPHAVFGGVIFSRIDLPLENSYLESIKNKTFMAVKKNSFGGWLMAKREFLRAGINSEKDFKSLSFGGTHDKVVDAVREGRVEVGNVRTGTLEKMALEGKINLSDFKIINPKKDDFFLRSTDLYPTWPIAVVSHDHEELAGEVLQALLSISEKHVANIQADVFGWTIPLNYQSVNDCLRELNYGPYSLDGKISFAQVAKKMWPVMLLMLFFTIFLIFLMILYKLEKMKAVKAMIVTYNHEINNPLTIAMGYSKRLSKKLEDERNVDMLDNIQKALKRIVEIIKTIDEIHKTGKIDIKKYTSGTDMVELDKED